MFHRLFYYLINKMSEGKTSKPVIPKPENLECKDLQEYLRTRPTEILEKFFNFPTICLAAYRELPEIAKQFVIRMLFVEQAVPQAVVSSWGSQVFIK